MFVDDMIDGLRITCRKRIDAILEGSFNDAKTCVDEIDGFEELIKKSLEAIEEGKGNDAVYYTKRALDTLEKGGGCSSCKNILQGVIDAAANQSNG
jgi:hypothetical protein